MPVVNTISFNLHDPSERKSVLDLILSFDTPGVTVAPKAQQRDDGIRAGARWLLGELTETGVGKKLLIPWAAATFDRKGLHHNKPMTMEEIGKLLRVPQKTVFAWIRVLGGWCTRHGIDMALVLKGQDMRLKTAPDRPLRHYSITPLMLEVLRGNVEEG